jgi:hypothetical protein
MKNLFIVRVVPIRVRLLLPGRMSDAEWFFPTAGHEHTDLVNPRQHPFATRKSGQPRLWLIKFVPVLY